MALNVAKITFSFVQGVYGWTESYYRENPSSTLVAELNKGNTLAQKRIAMSGTQTVIQDVKVSNELLERDVLIGATSYFGASSHPSDAPDTAILTKRYTTTPIANAPIYIRGIWDEIVKDGGALDLSNPAWNAAYGSYKGELETTGNGWGFLAKDRDASATSDLSLVAQNVNGTIRFTAADFVFAGLGVGNRIKVFVSGVGGALSANGSHIVVIRDNNNADTIRRIPMFPYQAATGKITTTVLKFYPIGQLQIQRVVERKVGRPLYVSRGRSPARKLG